MFPTTPRCRRRSICTSATRPSSRTATRVSRSPVLISSSFSTGSHVNKPAVGHREDEPRHRPGGDERGTAVRDEREGDPRRRQEADVHRDVADGLAGDVRDEKKDEHRAAPVARVAREREGAGHEGPEEAEEGCDPGEPPLLGERGEDEVGFADREEPEPALRPLLPPLAEDPPGADRDPR